ncbi:baseplate J/gp47 family protein [uncultured Tyzzerella sp.]|uniref:baseplate J/gp47 family protein n=1 Tax=uncultured Tyzzerella sp. TaxID=2321398 RepID=UPI002943654A|nr:baseplate J/gp47 family protein [uncultured Tyzzerella sp.]
MNFDKTPNEILNEFLQEIPDNYEKRKGYFLWDIIKAISIRMCSTLKKLTFVASKLDVNNLKGVELERFIKQRTGIERKNATYSQGVITVKGNGTVNIGDLFETDGLVRFEAIEQKNIIGTGTVNIECVTAGKIGNVPINSIKKMPVTITGINSCNNELQTNGGYDEETDTDLRNRYFERLREPATSGNIYHYKRWSKEVDGVGDARIIPLWQGHTTVKVIIIDNDRLPADESLVENVQEYIDPNITGEGRGQAPIGAFCTVISATPKGINISVKAIFSKNYDKEQLKKKVTENIGLYLKEIAFKKDFLSYAIVGSKILDIEGVLDYSNLTVNNQTSNIECQQEEVFVLEGIEFIE